jgi:hypothetical protein
VLKTSLALAGTGVGNVVCLFSDGIDTTSAVDVKTAMNAVAGTGVRMFGFGPSHTLSLTSWMESGAEATGGSFYREEFHGDERRIFDSMITEGYRLEVDLPRVVDEPRKWKLEVVGPDGKELPRVRLVYPRVVAPPVPAASEVQGSGSAPPPRQPDPIEILHEAQRDARAGRYERALEKHLWFHGNALKYERGARGVRLSFALAAWSELAQVHPPALAALRKVRDQAAERFGREHSPDAFADFAAINRELGEEARTVELFVRLDNQDPAMAGQVFSRDIRLQLVKAKEYALCGKYLKPNEDFSLALETYRRGKSVLSQAAPEAGYIADDAFTNDTAILIALLVVSGREQEAKDLARAAEGEWHNRGFHAAIEKALAGVVPEPPRRPSRRPWP